MQPARPIDVAFQGVEKRYGDVIAVRGLDLEVPRGSFYSLLGPSGCGKTTTLRMVAGFEAPTRGEVFIRGDRVTEVPSHRRNFGMVFQNYALFPHLSVAQNVAFGLKMRRVAKRERDNRVAEALATVKLADLGSRFPKQLSGGQQQRVALARAIVIRPAVLLLDEPLGALDKLLREEMQGELRALQQRLGITTVFVTHDQEEALTMSDAVAVMRAGVIEQIGTPAEIYERPRTEFVASFLGASNFLDGEVRGHTGDAAEIDLAGQTVRALCDARPTGSRVRFVVRPEKIHLSPDLAAPGLPAAIREIVYRGAQTHVHLESDGRRLLACVQNDAMRSWAPVVGMKVRAHWDASGAVVLATAAPGPRS